ncbi:amidohydrolase family protein [Rhodoplanes sp. TEM]|uniref:Amidohydrolase family protein n=1 Tax=Rhodoplanes tepidamans TaxID=200616 RepID=A0ABT5J7H8_RHOTP|nr:MULTISPECIES: amidohydrolase family protein [Rhodoplanes]MDC7785612.1 amidohydrolase family protein [Rhodoplanes tepidamans]MDC7985713.1 amidohydrolase family protein [Rhodoplanes sp. TEM]MDQ0354822.1 dihydroorotase (multifunctional complex type) [Rhodoplanes tepidamans]
MLDLVLADGELVVPETGVARGSVGIKDGRIAVVAAPGETLTARETIDCSGRWVFPGLIDPHTHVGFGDKERDFGTEARSAALGGVTALFTFHRSADLRESSGPWIAEGERRSCIDFGLHFGLTSALHIDTLQETAKRFGVSSFKVYLMYKGAAGAAKGFTEIDDGLLFRTMLEARRVPGGVVGVHCENVEVIPVFRGPLKAAGRNDLAAWDEQSPDFLEAENVSRVIYFAAKAECPVNIVHLSSREGLEIVRRHRAVHRNPVHVETCAHYLTMTRDDPAGILAKVNPPLRRQTDCDALWEGVADGSIETVGSDHVPRKVATKGTDLWSASAGFPGLATLLPLMIEDGHYGRGLPLTRIAAVTSLNVARLYGLPSKGSIAAGKDADLVVVDPHTKRAVDHATLASFSDYTPMQGRMLRGWPVHTLVRGRPVVADGRLTEAALTAPAGRYLRRAV